MKRNSHSRGNSFYQCTLADLVARLLQGVTLEAAALATSQKAVPYSGSSDAKLLFAWHGWNQVMARFQFLVDPSWRRPAAIAIASLLNPQGCHRFYASRAPGGNH